MIFLYAYAPTVILMRFQKSHWSLKDPRSWEEVPPDCLLEEKNGNDAATEDPDVEQTPTIGKLAAVK